MAAQVRTAGAEPATGGAEDRGGGGLEYSYSLLANLIVNTTPTLTLTLLTK